MKNDIIQFEFQVSGTSFHQQAFSQAIESLSDKQNYRGKTDDEISEYLKTSKTGRINKYDFLKTNKVKLIPEPDNIHDEFAIKVLINDIFIGYVDALTAEKINKYFVNDRYSYVAIAKIYSGPYKTIDLQGNVIWHESDLQCDVQLQIKDNSDAPEEKIRNNANFELGNGLKEHRVNKLAYCLLAFFLGSIGGQYFYMKEFKKGFLCFFLSWTTVPMFIGFYHGIKAIFKPFNDDDTISIYTK